MNSQHTWICVICGAGFTRKSSANRHNQNLHTGNGTIVRPLEYIIGRLNGKFHEPKDTLLFRKNNNNTRIQNNDLNPLMYTHEIYNNTNSYSNIDNNHDKHEKQVSYSEVPDWTSVKSQRPQYYHAVNDNQSISLIERLRKMSKLEKFTEFQKIVNKYYSPLYAQKMLNVATVFTFNLGDESFLDDQLKLLAS
jgi:hypothetical protein